MSEYLPQDIMMKILSRLDPKTLITFKLVSKSWNLMISDPFFIRLHTAQTLMRPDSPEREAEAEVDRLIVRCYSKTLNTEVYSVYIDDEEFNDTNIRIEYPFRDYVRFYYRIVGSCNGVLCLLDDQFGEADSIQLWNPVILRKLTLPPPPSKFEDLGTCMVVLGFGFDEGSHDYKVVRIAYEQGDCEYLLPPRVEVYSLNGGGWHAVTGEIPNCCVPEHFWSQVFMNGRSHWVAYKVMGRNGGLENLIMAFDFAREVFDEMPLPAALEGELSFNLAAVDLGGRLAVVRYDERVWSTRCCVWVMRRYGDAGSWSRDYDVGFGVGIGMVLGLRGNGEVLVTTRYGGLVSFDPVEEVYEELVLFGTRSSYYVGPYRESLVLLTEGVLARQRLPSDYDSESDVEIEIETESQGEGEGEDEMDCDSVIKNEDKDKDEDEDEDEDGDEDDDEDEDEDRLGDVEKSEFWMKCSMCQYLTALLRRPYL